MAGDMETASTSRARAATLVLRWDETEKTMIPNLVNDYVALRTYFSARRRSCGLDTN